MVFWITLQLDIEKSISYPSHETQRRCSTIHQERNINRSFSIESKLFDDNYNNELLQSGLMPTSGILLKLIVVWWGSIREPCNTKNDTIFFLSTEGQDLTFSCVYHFHYSLRLFLFYIVLKCFSRLCTLVEI